MKSVYECCPILQGNFVKLELVTAADAKPLLDCYSDEKAVPFFNSDNCHGDDFHYTAIEQMKQAVAFWLFSYEKGYFVRMTIKNFTTNEILGTIEIFHRKAQDYFNDCALLRIDLKSSAEKQAIITDILCLCQNELMPFFDTNRIVTKAVPAAQERIVSLKKLGYVLCSNKLLDQYDNYWELVK